MSLPPNLQNGGQDNSFRVHFPVVGIRRYATRLHEMLKHSNLDFRWAKCLLYHIEHFLLLSTM